LLFFALQEKTLFCSSCFATLCSNAVKKVTAATIALFFLLWNCTPAQQRKRWQLSSPSSSSSFCNARRRKEEGDNNYVIVAFFFLLFCCVATQHSKEGDGNYRRLLPLVELRN